MHLQHDKTSIIRKMLFLIFSIVFAFNLCYGNSNDCSSVEYHTSNDSLNKAEELIKQAAEERNNNNYEKARELALEAIKLNNTWGEPYLFIGVLYIDSYKICQDEALPRAVFCLAVDYFEKAKETDPRCSEKADTLINGYKKYFPSKEEIFDGPITGSKYFIGCWINEYTSVRYLEDM